MNSIDIDLGGNYDSYKKSLNSSTLSSLTEGSTTNEISPFVTEGVITFLFSICYILNVTLSSIITPSHNPTAVLFCIIVYTLTLGCHIMTTILIYANFEHVSFQTRIKSTLLFFVIFGSLNSFLFLGISWDNNWSVYIPYNLAIGMIEGINMSNIYYIHQLILTRMKLVTPTKVTSYDLIEMNLKESSKITIQQFFQNQTDFRFFQRILSYLSILCLASIISIFTISLFLYTSDSDNGYIFLLTTFIESPILILPLITTCKYNKILLELELKYLIDTTCMVIFCGIILKEEILIGSMCSMAFSFLFL